jgi:hypothetical protein
MTTHPYTRLFVLPSAPTADRDETEGYEIGDVVFSGGDFYDCADNTDGAAVWNLRATGAGDMLKSTYDANDDGLVDDAEKWHGYDIEVSDPDQGMTPAWDEGDNTFKLEQRMRFTGAPPAAGELPQFSDTSGSNLEPSGVLISNVVLHTLATAANDFLVASGAGAFVKKTVSEAVTILRTVLDTVFAPIAKGVTNGDSHDHNGGDGGTIAYSSLSGALVQDGGTYTPTLTNTTNIDASTVSAPLTWIRLGNYVIVFGGITVDPTATGNTVIKLSLPVASNFTTAFDCTGGGSAQAQNIAGNFSSDSTNDLAQLTFQATVTTNTAWRMQYSSMASNWRLMERS